MGTIFGLLTEKSHTEDLLKDHSTVLILAEKSLDERVIEIEVLERWHRLKIHGMPLLQYFGKGKIELLCQEIESFMRIKLKTISQWLINEEQLEEQLEIGNRRRSAIVIIMGNETEAQKLYIKGIRFRGAPKIVEKYWEARPISVCMTCLGIGHHQLKKCRKRLV